MNFCEVFFPLLHPLWSWWLRPHEPRGCVPESISTREGAVPEAGRNEKGGVYRPKDAFQLLLLTPFQSKRSGLFQVTSGQSTVGLAMSSRGRGENSTALGEDEVGDCSLREGRGPSDSCRGQSGWGVRVTTAAAVSLPQSCAVQSAVGEASGRCWGSRSSPGHPWPSQRLVWK